MGGILDDITGRQCTDYFKGTKQLAYPDIGPEASPDARDLVIYMDRSMTLRGTGRASLATQGNVVVENDCRYQVPRCFKQRSPPYTT